MKLNEQQIVGTENIVEFRSLIFNIKKDITNLYHEYDKHLDRKYSAYINYINKLNANRLFKIKVLERARFIYTNPYDTHPHCCRTAGVIQSDNIILSKVLKLINETITLLNNKLVSEFYYGNDLACIIDFYQRRDVYLYHDYWTNSFYIEEVVEND